MNFDAPKIFVSAGDVSGDHYAALLVLKMRELVCNLSFVAVGGERLKETGAEILEDSSNWSAIGIFDALPKIPRIYRALQRIKKTIKKHRVRGAILVDCPAFNLRLADAFHKLQIPAIYFFPPSHWRKDARRAMSVKGVVREVIAPFKDSAEIYGKAGVPTFFSGHPLVDLIRRTGDPRPIFEKLGLDPQRPLIGLLPGSREQEIRYLLPIELEAAGLLLKKNPALQFALPVATQSLEKQILSLVKKYGIPVAVSPGGSGEIMQISEALIIASGTATLEAALYQKPMVIVYKVSPLTWKLERPFLKGISFAGLPNLLSDKEIVPELIQEKATPQNIAKEIETLLKNRKRQDEMRLALGSIRSQLGEPGVLDRVARRALEILRV